MNTPATIEPEVYEVVEERAKVLRMNISHATDLWLSAISGSKQPRTRDTYRRLLDKLADTYPWDDVDEITEAKLLRFLSRWDHRSPATKAQNISILRGFFGWLKVKKWLKENPAKHLERPQVPRAEENDNITSITGAEVRKLLHAAEGWPEKLAVYTLAYLGPRRRAIAQARLADYDSLERTLTFREKGAKTIRKPVPDRLADLIDAAIADGIYNDLSDYLVPNREPRRKKGERDDRIIWNLVRQVAERVGVTTHVHALRAAFAVEFLRRNPGQLVALQELLGHRRVETTMVYLRRLNRSDAMESVRSLDWDASETFESSYVAEKEGFEPSKDANPASAPDSRQRDGDA